MIGARYHKLVIQDYAPSGKNWSKRWLCLCDCGRTVVVYQRSLRSGHTKSCGCSSSRFTVGERSTKHGRSKDPLYNIWSMIKRRCFRPDYKEWHLYGGRGITMCDRWVNSFASFLEDMGERPKGAEIDRIDNNKGYSPENCRWATPSENCRNRRTTTFISYKGIRLSVCDWADRLGIPSYLIHQRIKRGWSTEQALTQIPSRNRKPERVQFLSNF